MNDTKPSLESLYDTAVRKCLQGIIDAKDSSDSNTWANTLLILSYESTSQCCNADLRGGGES